MSLKAVQKSTGSKGTQPGVKATAGPAAPRTFEQRAGEFFAGRITPPVVANFLQSLSLLLRAGIQIGRSVEILADQEVHARMRVVLNQVSYVIEMHGQQLSNAMARHPQVFTQEVVLLVRSGEVAGDLSSRLEQAARLLERQIKLSNKIKEAVTSPLVTAGVCLAMTYGVVKFVLPRFLGLYDGMHMTLPLFSQIVIGTVKFLNNPVFTVGMLAVFMLMYAFRGPLMQKVMAWGLNFPGTRGFIGQILATSFCDVVAHLYADGVAISTALDMLAQTTRIKAYQDVLKKVSAQFKTDGKLADAVKLITFFPSAVVRMLTVGEESGEIDHMLICIGNIMDESNQELFTRVVTMLEPAMMGLVGAVLCFFFVGLFLPIYGLLNNLGM